MCSQSQVIKFSQHQGLFQWVNSLHEVAKVLEFQNLLYTCTNTAFGQIHWPLEQLVEESKRRKPETSWPGEIKIKAVITACHQHEAVSGVSGPGGHTQSLWAAQASCGSPNTSHLPPTSKGCCISEGSACLSSCHWHSSFTSEGSVVPGSFEHQLGIPAEVPPDSEHTTKCALSPQIPGWRQGFNRERMGVDSHGGPLWALASQMLLLLSVATFMLHRAE